MPAPCLGRPRQSRRVRLLAAATAPLTLAMMATASAAARPPGEAALGRAAHTAAVRGTGPLAVALPGLRARTVTVTLITGDQVRLTEVSPGRYTATAIPGSGASTQIDVRGEKSPQGKISLQAIPSAAAALVGSGQASRGLFDLLWLAAHGDTGPSARIPLTIQYPARPGAAALARAASRLPGATVTGASTARGQVSVVVAARRAAAFWATLTAHGPGAPAASGPPIAPAALAGGALRIWPTGHDLPTARPHPQEGQSLYPVTITYTRTSAGPMIPVPCPEFSNMPLGAGWLCIGPGYLLGVAGGGLDNGYDPSGYTCVKTKPARPYPMCTAEQASFTVPAGVYTAFMQANLSTTADADHTEEAGTAELDVPQFTVAGPTALTVNANRLVPVTITSPRPASLYGPSVLGTLRTTQDGTDVTNFGVSLDSQGGANYWALPTPAPERATIGSYSFFPLLTAGAPPITAEMTSPRHLALHPLYPCESEANPNCAPPIANWSPMVQFSGSHTLQVVNAKIGTPADFRTIDARGKLALIYPYMGLCGQRNPWPGYQCAQGIPNEGQLAAARKAGAAGVLFAAGFSGYGHPWCCWPRTLPMPVWTGSSPLPASARLPFAELDRAEAGILASALARSPAAVTIADHGTSPYTYTLAFYQEGGISATQHYTVSPRRLAEVTDSYHGTSASLGTDYGGYAAPAALDQFLAFEAGWDFPGPLTMHDYYGPVSPGLTWTLSPTVPDRAFVPGDVFARPGQSATGWDVPPLAPGTFGENPAVFQEDPGQFTLPCAGCRQGRTFYPWFMLASGANPGSNQGLGLVGFPPRLIHLYDQAGREVPPVTFQGVATFRLPPGKQRYKLAASYDLTAFGATARTATTWRFTSAAPASGQYAPSGYSCVGTLRAGSTAPCNVPPLVYLRYNAYPSLLDTLGAPGTHLLQVTGYHQDPSAPPVTSLKLWLSTNGGTTWQQAHLTGSGGTWTTRYTLPQLSQTNGYLSIKAIAADAAGNDVTQTILDAVKLGASTVSTASPQGR